MVEIVDKDDEALMELVISDVMIADNAALCNALIWNSTILVKLRTSGVFPSGKLKLSKLSAICQKTKVITGSDK